MAYVQLRGKPNNMGDVNSQIDMKKQRIHVQLTLRDKQIDWYNSLTVKAQFFQTAVDRAYNDYLDRQTLQEYKE